MPFVLDDNTTCDKNGAKEVWLATAQFGLDKHQCTVQLTIFGNGDALPPLINFRGQGIRINPAEKKSWNSRFKVLFQLEAWCDENIMKRWIGENWNNALLNPPMPGSSGKILFADVHTAQQTASVKVMLHKCNTSLINIPRGATSRVQQLDVVINKPFKNYVRGQFEKHIDEDLSLYVESKLTLADRRILTTKWVANVCDKIKVQKDMIRKSFLKCGLTNALHGSEEEFLNIRGMEVYTIPEPEKEFELVSDADSDEDDDYVINENVSDGEETETDNSSDEEEAVTDNSSDEEDA